ncbi:hypothetical protein P170DRAFT_34029 [Aspergillus steynii IBT 23096]|uniref:Yeast cell wall synthesis Kre9/Knh1-like N-terminal domain-containing protein n=1 Tax=Aspergillus steynii IBT 23096 TaxID=1392250 RepID=A0A2I2GQK8_9EURO|nr:uncharacterized protein P170DRAFT_34029 [Aspergillus steynii IBT 23096]PLB55151.1 hypothetical protein P170DRAFT_34029 [Aspergillus steynii IBT 23096]
MRFSIAAVFSAVAALVSAHTDPDYNQSPTGNAIYTPGLNQQVEAGKPFVITWDPTTEGPVSLVLLRGPSNNVVPIDTIAEQVPNSGSFTWTPSTSLEDDVTHYGLMIIVEGTGQYQYSTQFGVTNPSYGSSSSSSTTAKAAPTTAPAAVTTHGAFSTRYETYEVTTTICPESAAHPTGKAPASSIPLIGTGRVSVPAVSPSQTPVRPGQPKASTLASSAVPSGTPSSTGPSTPVFTGAAGRNVVGFGAVAAGVLAVLAF